MRLPTLGFQAFTIKSTGLVNKIVTEIALSEACDLNSLPDPKPTLVPTKALWDTGATGSVITRSMAVQLGLKSVGTQNVNHAGGSEMCSTYMVNIYLPNKVCIQGVRVTDCADASHFGAIIGMDIIMLGDFALTNYNGKSCLSFRIPSMHTIDYVDEHNRQANPKQGRNDPCHCGSGKKNKHCHGRNT